MYPTLYLFSAGLPYGQWWIIVNRLLYPSDWLTTRRFIPRVSGGSTTYFASQLVEDAQLARAGSDRLWHKFRSSEQLLQLLPCSLKEKWAWHHVCRCTKANFALWLTLRASGIRSSHFWFIVDKAQHLCWINIMRYSTAWCSFLDAGRQGQSDSLWPWIYQLETFGPASLWITTWSSCI